MNSNYFLKILIFAVGSVVSVCGVDHGVDLAWMNRRAEIEALRHAAALRIEQTELAGAFHPLGDGYQPKVAPEAERGAHDRCGARVVLQGTYEGTVDLDLVERKPTQVAERRISDAEVVDRDAYATALDPAQGLEVGFGILHQYALGDLQLKAFGGEAAAL